MMIKPGVTLHRCTQSPRGAYRWPCAPTPTAYRCKVSCLLHNTAAWSVVALVVAGRRRGGSATRDGGAGRQRPRAAAERAGSHRWPLPAARAPGPAVGPRSWGRQGAAVSAGTAALAGLVRRAYLHRHPFNLPSLLGSSPFSPARTRRLLFIARNSQACRRACSNSRS